MKLKKVDAKLARRQRGYNAIIKNPKCTNPRAYTMPGSRNWRKGG